MYYVYAVSLIVLLSIMLMLWIEERRFRQKIVHGLASKFWILAERRKYVRFNDEIKLRYNPVSDLQNIKYSKTANISRKGLCLLTYEKLKLKDFLEIELEAPDFSRPVKVIGQVMWAKDLHAQDAAGKHLFYTGVRFYKINSGTEAVLLTHLNKLKQP